LTSGFVNRCCFIEHFWIKDSILGGYDAASVGNWSPIFRGHYIVLKQDPITLLCSITFQKNGILSYNAAKILRLIFFE
jgi:hypothetical protein